MLTTSQVGESQVTTSGSKEDSPSRMIVGALEVMGHIHPNHLIMWKGIEVNCLSTA